MFTHLTSAGQLEAGAAAIIRQISDQAVITHYGCDCAVRPLRGWDVAISTTARHGPVHLQQNITPETWNLVLTACKRNRSSLALRVCRAEECAHRVQYHR